MVEYQKISNSEKYKKICLNIAHYRKLKGMTQFHITVNVVVKWKCNTREKIKYTYIANKKLCKIKNPSEKNTKLSYRKESSFKRSQSIIVRVWSYMIVIYVSKIADNSI